MLSKLILNKQWVSLIQMIIMIWVAVFMITTGAHYLFYGVNNAYLHSFMIASIGSVLICIQAFNRSIFKRQLHNKIADLNNKLTPLCFLPQIMKSKGMNDDDTLLGTAVRDAENSIDKVTDIIKDIHEKINFL